LLAEAIRPLPTNQQQLSKHDAGQFEWIIKVPRWTGLAKDHTALLSTFQPGLELSDGDKKLYFGCNLLHRAVDETEDSSRDQLANSYTLIATRLNGDSVTGPTDNIRRETSDRDSMITTQTMGTDTESVVIRITEPQMVETTSARRTSEVALMGKNDDIVEQIIALPPANPSSRIEDSVEALDKLEDELEELNAVTRVPPVLSPDVVKMPVMASLNVTPTRTGSVSRRPGIKQGSSTVRVKPAERMPLVRTRSLTRLKDGENTETEVSPQPKRGAVTRPASLLPPKTLAKSTRPLTKSTFELPGEAIARRLKEQREARMSQQISEEQAAAIAAAFSPSKPHVKSTKAPTRPNFELPGEAISRRKRAEREAKLKREEDEERKRREFKAKPIRASLAPGSFPRETIASRARQGKAEPSTSSSNPKRQSMMGGTIATSPRSSLKATTSTATATTASSRGRPVSMLGSPSSAVLRRADSSSNDSIHGGGSVASKRSTMSAEEVQYQKERGREIYSRDNSLTHDRERGRRDREDLAKQARQEAAERSRQASRQWAEKQRLKRMSILPAKIAA
jgi:hypothetical protein